MSPVNGGHRGSGAFYEIENKKRERISANTKPDSNTYMGFSASRSNSIYGNSTTVQPPALTLRPIIKY